MGWKARAGTSVGAIVLGLAAAFIPHREGTVLHTYRDVVGVLTACNGHTGPELKLGQQFTPEDCQAMLQADLEKHYDGIASCLPLETMTAHQQAAMLSLAFNVGVGSVCRSSLPGKWLAGNSQLACATIDSFVLVGGKDCRIASSNCRGIVLRRAAERAMCEEPDS